MPVNTKAIGKSYDPVLYAVGREKIKEYARAVSETNPVHLDVEAARAAGYPDGVAPPMFAVVYSAPSVGPPIFDPEIELNFAVMGHGGKEPVWCPTLGGARSISGASRCSSAAWACPSTKCSSQERCARSQTATRQSLPSPSMTATRSSATPRPN